VATEPLQSIRECSLIVVSSFQLSQNKVVTLECASRQNSGAFRVSSCYIATVKTGCAYTVLQGQSLDLKTPIISVPPRGLKTQPELKVNRIKLTA
jgi:hypothetical protein